MGRFAPSASVEIGGRAHTLLLDMNAVVTFEETTKQSFLHFVNSLGEGTSFKDLRTLIWCAFLHEKDPDFATPEQVGALIPLDEFVPLLATLTDTIRKSLPSEETPGPNPTGPSIGAPSGLSGGSILDSPTTNSGD